MNAIGERSDAVLRTAMPQQASDFWFDVGSLQEIPVRGSRRVKTPRREIAIFRTASDEVFALENRCPHKGGPLSEGIVHGRKVACPLHNWIINLEDGEATGADKGCARSFPVKLENGRVYLDMSVAAAP
jgi:nitrite reductase (NADH) small subunit